MAGTSCATPTASGVIALVRLYAQIFMFKGRVGTPELGLGLRLGLGLGYLVTRAGIIRSRDKPA